MDYEGEGERMKLTAIKPNPDNPRIIKDAEFHKLVASIKRYPDFMAKRGIVHADGVILGGNMRYRAIQEALKDEAFRAAIGVKSASEIPDAWIQDASDWTVIHIVKFPCAFLAGGRGRAVRPGRPRPAG
jgi:hypothetical protein